MRRTDKNKSIKAAMAWAQHHRSQLEGIAVELASLMNIAPGTADSNDLRAAAFGEIEFSDAMLRIVNRKLDELSTIEIDGVIDPQTA